MGSNPGAGDLRIYSISPRIETDPRGSCGFGARMRMEGRCTIQSQWAARITAIRPNLRLNGSVLNAGRSSEMIVPNRVLVFR